MSAKTSDSTNRARGRRLLLSMGRFLFRYRGYTPLPLAVIVVWQARVTVGTAIAGLVVITLGELVRLAAVRASGGATRTRRIDTGPLITWGAFAHVRHPHLLGNLLLWTGIIAFSGGAWLAWLLMIGWAFFVVQYALMAAAREAALAEVYGPAYEAYRSAVPGFVPRLRRPGPEAGIPIQPTEGGSHRLRDVLRFERSTLEILVGVLALSLFATVLKG